ncbi:MAG: succinate-semialdehyde dehydrogenase (NADP(+)), partial [Propionibacteriaceae bacterium]|jgi:succinate-semialdehyde dehydrogenase/glutarate-semialdehyde dehydrogenase|nr:succinate-semialdehyde dehydrogenase (NADP(+)) [Propionibacteriaceae bacterium]
MAVYSPLDGQLVGEVPVCTTADVTAAVERARRAQPAWANLSPRRRAERLLTFRQRLVERRDDLLDLVHWENGKARYDAFEEFLDVVLTSGYYGAKGARILRPEHRPGAIPGLTQVQVNYVPKGVVGVITPWNYPLTLSISDALAALVAGNAVILKPDSQTPFTALLLVSLLYEAGFPQDLLQVVTGPGAHLGPPLIEAIDYLMFTGSSATGARLAEQCGRRLIGCSAELGGKNPMLVLADADPERAARGAVRGCFANSGQLCMSIERLYVNRAVYDDFTARFVAETEALRLGTANDWSVDLGPLIDDSQFAKVDQAVRDALDHGAVALTGGSPRLDLGPHFYPPTILTGVDETMALYREETFGPVVALTPVDSDEMAIRLANDSTYGLNASVWSGSARHARAVGRQLRCGTVNLNDSYAPAYISLSAPMGGFGRSGLNRRHGPEGLRKYTEPQTVATQRLMPLVAPPGMAPERFADWATRSSQLLFAPLSRRRR